MKKFLNRIKEVLPEGEVSLFVSALERCSQSPLKSLRVNALSSFYGHTAEKIRKLEEVGLKILGPVPWCEQGFFFNRILLGRQLRTL